MSPLLKATVLKRLSKTWPAWGMTVDGCVYEHPMSGHRITATGGFYLPTPTCNMVSGGANHNSPSVIAGKHGLNLAGAVQMWPTPTAHLAKETNAPSESTRNTPTLTAQAGGKLNPTWVEWLMGWPLGWTNLKQSVTGKSPSKSQQRLPSWLRSK